MSSDEDLNQAIQNSLYSHEGDDIFPPDDDPWNIPSPVSTRRTSRRRNVTSRRSRKSSPQRPLFEDDDVQDILPPPTGTPNIMGYTVRPSGASPRARPSGVSPGTRNLLNYTSHGVDDNIFSSIPASPIPPRRKVKGTYDDPIVISSPETTPQRFPNERDRAEIEANARRMSRLEIATEAVQNLREPMEQAKKRMDTLYQKYMEAKQNYETLQEHYDGYTRELDDPTVILEDQNIKHDRALMQDKYGVTITSSPIRVSRPTSPVISRPVSPVNSRPVSPKPPFPVSSSLPLLDLGVEVILRFEYPDGKKSEHKTYSKQTLDEITKEAISQFGKPLKMRLIPGMNMTPTTTLEELGYKTPGTRAVFRFALA